MKNNLKIPLIILFALIGFGVLLVLILCSPYIIRKVQIWELTRNMTGGTSLVYEIDTRGLGEEEKKDLAQRMVTILRRRVDPRGNLPIIWRPQGQTRFEVQIPPAANFPMVKDIQRMLKGSGILEFRILPTEGHPDVNMAEIKNYTERMMEKGPEQASDSNFVWCEIENFNEWKAVSGQNQPTIVAQFADKYYVLASNKIGETMLSKDAWKLEKAYPASDSIGRRAIGFSMNDAGGKLMANVTGKNIDRPLCILIDGIALSAPNIEERIPSGQGIITGRFTETEIQDMVNKLNAGCLPAKLIEQPVEIKTIGAKVGP